MGTIILIFLPPVRNEQSKIILILKNRKFTKTSSEKGDE